MTTYLHQHERIRQWQARQEASRRAYPNTPMPNHKENH